jgi:small subunit ribosomal protein S18
MNMTTPTTPTPSNPETPAQPTAAPAAATPSTYTPRPAGQGGYRPGGQGGYRPGGPHRSGPGGSSDPRNRGAGGGRGGRRMGPPRRKVCQFCAEKVFEVDYKAIHILRNFMTARGKLLAGRTTGNCARHQRQMTSAIKRAQNLALLPFTDA